MGVNTDLIIHLYSDSDKSDYENTKIIANGINQCWVNTAYIHRNQYMNEKDFGVPINRIIDSKIKIK